MPRLHRVSAIVLLTIVSVSFFVASPTFARPKTDEVILLNGDHVTCEIKELKRGKLKIKTDSMGTVDVEWEDVVGVKSEFYYRVETAEGRRFYGALSMFKGDKKLQVVGLTTAVSLTQDRVVEITPIRRTFWAAIDGNFSIGFDFNKAGNQAQLTLDWRTQYRTERNYYDLKVTSLVISRRDTSSVSQRQDATLAYNRILSRRGWGAGSTLSYQRNDELALDWRIIATINMSLNPIRSNHHELPMTVGIAVNAEQGADSTSSTTSLELSLGARYQFYIYNTPKRDIDTSAQVFPSLTESGRIRFNYDIKLMYEIINDFTFNLTFYYALDNKPPDGGDRSTDYGINTGLGYTY